MELGLGFLDDVMSGRIGWNESATLFVLSVLRQEESTIISFLLSYSFLVILHRSDETMALFTDIWQQLQTVGSDLIAPNSTRP